MIKPPGVLKWVMEKLFWLGVLSTAPCEERQGQECRQKAMLANAIVRSIVVVMHLQNCHSIRRNQSS